MRSKHAYPKELVRTAFEDKGTTVLVSKLYRWRVDKFWANYECIEGKWSWKSAAVDSTIPAQLVQFHAV